jgi:hypothetical protein
MANRVTGFEQITGLNVVKQLTVPAGSSFASIRAVTQNVRYRLDGTDPEAGIGEQIKAGADQPTILVIQNGMIAAKFIQEASSAVLNVHYFA